MPIAQTFTYGSLMYADIFERVAGRVPECSPATLNNWRRHALRDRTYPGAVQELGHSIRGVLWHDISDSELIRLDAFESSEYQRIEVEVTLESGQTLMAQIYAWLNPGLLEVNDWSQDDFEKNHRPAFFAMHRPR